MKTNINSYLYAGFFLWGLYLLTIKENVGDAAIYLGIALAFDPFDVNQKWNDRPTWQKALLILHLTLVILSFVHTFWIDIKTGFLDGISSS